MAYNKVPLVVHSRIIMIKFLHSIDRVVLQKGPSSSHPIIGSILPFNFTSLESKRHHRLNANLWISSCRHCTCTCMPAIHLLLRVLLCSWWWLSEWFIGHALVRLSGATRRVNAVNLNQHQRPNDFNQLAIIELWVLRLKETFVPLCLLILFIILFTFDLVASDKRMKWVYKSRAAKWWLTKNEGHKGRFKLLILYQSLHKRN